MQIFIRRIAMVNLLFLLQNNTQACEESCFCSNGGRAAFRGQNM